MKKRSASHTTSKKWKKLTIVAFIAVITGTGVLFYLDRHSKNTFQPERFLPENVLLFSKQKNIGPVVEDFASTALGKTLFTTSYARLALDLEAPLDVVEKIREIQDFFLSDTGRMVYEEFLRNEFTVALLPDTDAETLETLLYENLIVFAQPRHNPSLFNLAFDSFNGNIEHSTSQYGRYIIHRIELDGFVVSFTAIDSNFIFCFEERTLRDALDRYDDKSATLLENFFYSELAESSKGAYLFSYFSFERIQQHLLALIDRRGNANQLHKSRLQRFNGLSSGAFMSWNGAPYNRDKITIYFNKNQLDPKTAAFFSMPPEVNTSISMVPSASSLYYWTNTFDLKAMWQVYASESGLDTETISTIKKNVELVCGISFNELLDLVDNTVHIVLSEPSNADFVPFPNFTLVLKLTDEKLADDMLKQLLANTRVPHINDSYRDVPFTFWGAQMQRGLQPAYSIHDKALYISSSVKTHMNVIDTLMSEQNLIGNTNYQKSAVFFDEPNNSTIFIQFPQFIDSMEELIKWAGEMLAIQNRRTAYKARKAIYGFVLPVLEGMYIYESAATRSYVTDGKLIIETHINKNNTAH